MQKAKLGENAYLGWTPNVPNGCALEFGSEAFLEAERVGVQVLPQVCFGLVAGGIGERLGYSGIKVALPVDTISNKCYLQVFIERILALEEIAKATLPLVIMVSEGTESATKKLLVDQDYFGMKKEQISIVKQNDVACFTDSDATLAVHGNVVETKPHGHGDLHGLMYQHQVARKWVDMGKKYFVVFQDTNALVCNSFLALVGSTHLRKLHVNLVAVRRKAKDASGGIMRLTKGDQQMIVNVEYNQLDALLKDTINADGDVNELNGYSAFPGNINLLAFQLEAYADNLDACQGIIAEFVNPKYNEESRDTFKKPARLECMMQDYPKVVPNGHQDKIGFTMFPSWLVYSPCKNNVQDAIQKVHLGIPPQCTSSAEHEYFACHARMLAHVGVKIQPTCREKSFLDLPIQTGPQIVWHPSLGTSFEVLSKRMKGNISVSNRSTLILEGQDITIRGLVLDGALRIIAHPQAKVVVHALHVQNRGWEYLPPSDCEVDRMRGYKLNVVEERLFEFNQPGEYIIEE